VACGSCGPDGPAVAGCIPLPRRAAPAEGEPAQGGQACPQLAVVIEHHGERAVLRPVGELDASSRYCLRRAIGSALERHPPILVVDLSGLSFTDCAGLSVLVWAHKRLAGRGHELRLTGGNPVIRRLLHLTGLDGYLHHSIPEPVTDAVAGRRHEHAPGEPGPEHAPGEPGPEPDPCGETGVAET
jgi:anti-anti-sigma factor